MRIIRKESKKEKGEKGKKEKEEKEAAGCSRPSRHMQNGRMHDERVQWSRTRTDTLGGKREAGGRAKQDMQPARTEKLSFLED